MWELSCQTYMSSLVKLQKKSCQNDFRCYPRTHTDPIFTDVKLLKCDEMNKYLVGRLIYRIHNEDGRLFNTTFIKDVQVYNYDTRQRDYYNVPEFISRLGKINLQYNSVIFWNSMLSSGDPVDASFAVFIHKLEMCHNWR